MEFLDGFKAVELRDLKKIPGAIGDVLVKVTSFPTSEGYPSEYPKHPERRLQPPQPELDFDGSATAQASPHFYEDSL